MSEEAESDCTSWPLSMLCSSRRFSSSQASFLPAPWCQALGAGDTDRTGASLAASAVNGEALVREGALEEEEQLS